jgi:peptide/nickel transport system substrate-binding protein
MAGSFDIDQLEPLVALEYPAGDDGAQPTMVHEDGILKLYRGYLAASAGGIGMVQRVSTEGGNPFIGSGKLDGKGVPPDFFSDIHVRKGFNYCFDWDTYIRDVLHGDAVKSRGPIITGLQGYRADSPVYTYDLEKCAAELAQAWGGQLPAVGFQMTTWVPETAGGATPGTNEWDLLADSLARVNPKYKLDKVAMDWGSIGDNTGRFAITGIGWMEDYHDASNWAQPFMHSTGVLSFASAWPAELSARVDALVDQAAVEADPSKRDALYAQLQQIAYDEALAVYTTQALGRYYLRREVNGWYDNPVTPYEAKGWYHLWKSEP